MLAANSALGSFALLQFDVRRYGLRAEAADEVLKPFEEEST